MRRMGWDHGDVMPLLATLQEHSLLYRAAREGHESRLAMLELVREYARERLSEAGETEMVSSAHAVHFLTLAEEAARYLRGTSQQGRWMERLDRERENLRAALRWFMRQGDGNAMVRYCAGLWWYWVTRGELREGFKVTGNALAHSQSVTRAWAVTLLAHGSFALRLGRFTLATGVLEQSAEMFATLDDTAGRAEALLTLGLARGQAGDMLHGRPLVEESYRQARTLGDAWLIGYALDTLARLAWQVGDLVETRRLALEGLRIAGDVGEFRAHVSPRKLLASAALAEGTWDEARRLGRALFAIARRISDRESEFHALLTLGTAHYAQEDFLPAERSFRAAARLARASGHERNLSQALARLGDTALAQGNEALASLLVQRTRWRLAGRCSGWHV
jgi:tetratricopeptide (TPR) repeat protein